jgi:hypothetical protein
MFTPSWDQGILFFTIFIENRGPSYVSGEVPREGEGKESKNE